jgi:hypothetical protein
VRCRAFAWLTHALDVNIDELAQLRHKLADVYSGTAVDKRRILPGEQ